ncbi:potassium-transporting ATPase subunit KdpC [Immundisolibacter sp.]|uniref:potassium-transporting ATPase subunit KdpC n=1 Tax=Immundisolibacter sp. TaxID=1934948 RepID=UPI002B0F3843|nr:potassium-transporting ATPase subunit KdpC [Immundisolibacter sp.]MEA3219525.1 Potassium-transporting ATPase KdpC subunit [Immundisolibacter sp.]
MTSLLRPALSLFVLLGVLTGLAYPLAVTGVGQLLFAHAANGSILAVDGKPVGSALIGQSFTGVRYFWGRPSATGPFPYNAAISSGSNLGPLNPALRDAVKARMAALRAADPANDQPVPIDLVTASGSGLDPDISLAAARYQVARVAKARGLAVQQVSALIEQHAARPWLGILGEPRVNVLRLNLALDGHPVQPLD